MNCAQSASQEPFYFHSQCGATCQKNLLFSLITNKRGVVGGGGWGHTVVTHEGQQGVRARARAAAKALEGDDKHILRPLQ